MLLTTGPSMDFIKFFQVLSWIILAIGLPAVLLTVFFHYRKKKQADKITDGNEDDLIQSSPELMGYTKGDGEYVFFDHSPLISKFKKKLSYNHARYAALRSEFEKLEGRYSDLADYTVLKLTNGKTTDMAIGNDKMPKSLQKEMAKLAAAYRTEKEELLAKLERMNQSYRELEAESQSLADQVKIHSATQEERTVILDRWVNENTLLKDKLGEQQFVHELLIEKKTQINFLQDQLEQKIKDNYHLDQQRSVAVTRLDEERENQKGLLHSIDEMKDELLQKNEEADKLQTVICGKEEQLAGNNDQLKTKDEQINWLENTWNESKLQNAALNEVLAENRNAITSLQQQLIDEQARRAEIEQNLQIKENEMQQLYNSLVLISGKGKEKAFASGAENPATENIVEH